MLIRWFPMLQWLKIHAVHCREHIELNYNLLRFQLGVSADTKIILTETLDNMTSEINVEALLSQEFDHRQNVNYQLIEGQEKMSCT